MINKLHSPQLHLQLILRKSKTDRQYNSQRKKYNKRNTVYKQDNVVSKTQH